MYYILHMIYDAIWYDVLYDDALCYGVLSLTHAIACNTHDPKTRTSA